MDDNTQYGITESLMVEKATLEHIEDYTRFLKPYGIDYRTDDYYIHVGEPRVSQGWLMHLTVIPSQMPSLLHTILPPLIEFGVPFQIVKNTSVHSSLNGGDLGNFKIGKAVTLFLDDDFVIEPLTRRLIDCTSSFVGPQPYTDFYISPIISARYGAFTPEVQTDPFGNRHRVIKDTAGDTLMDKYYQPPYIPKGINIPFLSLVPHDENSLRTTVLGNKYLPVKLLKVHPKGNVSKALRLKYGFLPYWCVVKQGKHGMFPDESGRDIGSRLQWQAEVNRHLSIAIQTPKIFDYLEICRYSYIVMDYVKKGDILISIVNKKMRRTAWIDQPLDLKMEMLEYLIQICRQIQTIHDHQYVHRDITGSNFLVTKKQKVLLIDLELIYSIKGAYPVPPFGIGTPGYMSPEQESNDPRPTIKEDIYSIGALCLLIFSSGIEPGYLNDRDLNMLKNRISLLLDNESVVDLIQQCLEYCPDKRPEMSLIINALQQYKNSLTAATPKISANKYRIKADIDTVISNGLAALAGNSMVSAGLWYSHVENEYGFDVYPMGNKHVFIATHHGVSGVIWTLAELKRAGFPVEIAGQNISRGLSFIKEQLLTHANISSSLHYGLSGVAVSLCSAIRQGLIPYFKDWDKTIRSSFETKSQDLNIIYGTAGQGVALLRCMDFLEVRFASDVLQSYANQILERQLTDGSWITHGNTDKTYEKMTGFGYGIAGIVYFLLEYGQQFNNTAVLDAARRGLEYLSSVGLRQKTDIEWHNSNRDNRISSWWCQGGPGIALSFLKYYEIFKDEYFLSIAEKSLAAIPRHFIASNLSLCHGLSGLGEIYMEAYQQTNSEEWLQRAHWIANLLVNFARHDAENRISWMCEKFDFPTADLMIGSSGIMHFLLRYKHQDLKFGFPLL